MRAKVSKKEIKQVLRSLDKTAIFRLYARINRNVDRFGLYQFIQEYAPSKRVANMAYTLAYDTHHNNVPYDLMTQKQKVVEYLKEQIKDVTSPYAKQPMWGNTHLYFCSPVYGHHDYNKWAALPINGNERFCELIIAIGKKYFG